MLCELRVRQLGVIEDLTLVFGPGMTALTGETGAGKTLVVEAVELLLGGRAGPTLVRPGAEEAVVEGRFVLTPGPDAGSQDAGPGPDAGSQDAGREDARSKDARPEHRSGNDGPKDLGAEGPEGASWEGGSVLTGGEREVVVSRVVPRQGRSRAYVNASMATASSLAELGGRLVDLHGQHEQQSLLSLPAQRDALDAYAGAQSLRARRDKARERLKRVEVALATAGGNSEREREVELLRYQLSELEAAKLTTPDEDEQLAEEQEALARASEHRAAAELAHEVLAGDDQLVDRLGRVVAQLAGHPPLAALHSRLRGLLAELADAGHEARSLAESLEDDPGRLAEVTERRAVLQGLRRKYAGQGAPTAVAVGTAGSLADVFAWREAAEARLKQLEDLSGEVSRLAAERASAMAELSAAAGELGAARRKAAGRFARAVEAELRRLAMPAARFSVQVGQVGRASSEPHGRLAGEEAGSPGQAPLVLSTRDGDDLRELSGEDVCFLFAASAGEPLLPLAKVASGGELARAMLALRLVLLEGQQTVSHPEGEGGNPGGESPEGEGGNPGGERLSGALGAASGPVPSGPGTLIFDEVDAGIGGQAALAVGKALAELAKRYQVVVVTHLPQVAAFANGQIVVSKSQRGGRAIATAAPVFGEQRVVELSRMLSGKPGSKTAKLHAEELLRTASAAPAGEASARHQVKAAAWHKAETSAVHQDELAVDDKREAALERYKTRRRRG